MFIFYPFRLAFLFVVCGVMCTVPVSGQQSIIQFLSGTDKDHTVQWDFMCTTGMNAGKWSRIAVPSCWEQQGFGTYNYGTDRINPEEQGTYKYEFSTKRSWRDDKVFLVFEGVMTDAEVKINGISAGPFHQGAFTQFRYDITDLVKDGTKHQLEVRVNKKSANESVNRAERQSDFWLFGGIYRPVFLEVVPNTFIERVAVNAKANGTFGMQVFSKNTQKNQVVEIQVQQLNGIPVGKPFNVSAADSNWLTQTFKGIKTWNPEQPNLYNAVISIKEGKKIIHTIQQRFGFRTVEFRPHDGFYVNDVRIIMKGVCRHSEWTESGRTLSRAVHLMDIGLIKDMNMNAVRMSHYPPDREFLDLCDSLGLFVIDELTGWQKAYDTTAGRKLLKEMVLRDVNHPSIIIWANGNEGGWNRALDDDYDWYDPQKRFVMHPWERFRGTDTKHYPDYNYVVNSVLYGNEVFYPTEFMHGLFDGGHGAGLDDFWNEMRMHPYFAGGFLWALHDEGVMRTDKGGEMDVAGNLAPDGIVGPHREKEASYFTIKEIWSPVYVGTKTIPQKFNGKIAVENRYLYTNLKACRFKWQLVNFPKATDKGTAPRVVANGTAPSPDLAPGTSGFLQLGSQMIKAMPMADALYLDAFDAKGNKIFTWSWPLRQPEQFATKAVSFAKTGGVEVSDINNNTLQVSCDGIVYSFDKLTGYLQMVYSAKKYINLSGGPALAGVPVTLKDFAFLQQGDSLVIQSNYTTTGMYQAKWVFVSGKLPRLDYTYSVKGPVDFMGITFDYPEQNITGMRWLGQGPYRVWKNRLKGQQLGVWQKAYNNTITGESWIYPEFKGWHANLNWVTVQNKQSNFTIYAQQPNIFCQMLQPQKPNGAKNENNSPPFPEGNIGFMTAISPIGTKFQSAELLGPQSQKSMQLNYTPTSGTLWFDFR